MSEQNCQGPCACKISGRAVSAHMQFKYCPHPSGPKFGSGAAPAGWDSIRPVRSFGDTVEKWIKRSGLARLAQRAKFIESGCSACKHRREVLNVALPWSAIWKWMIEARQAVTEIAALMSHTVRRMSSRISLLASS
jgi:hypothetical protein